MQLQATQTADLLDGHNRRLGTVTVEQIEDDFVLGTFAPAPEFAAVEPLFSEFVEAANEQLFERVDELDSDILGLGLHLGAANGVPLPQICDVQIAGANISFRVKSTPNGTRSAVTSSDAADTSATKTERG